jgi:hypothetical protein
VARLYDFGAAETNLSIFEVPTSLSTVKQRSTWYLRPLMLAPLAIIAMLVPSPVVGHDSWLHLIWLEQFTTLVKDGMLYPRWLHLSNGGFGSPTFYFYPPLAAYIASLYSFFNSSAQDVGLFNFVAFVGTIGSVRSFRYYLKTIGVEKRLMWAGALVYAMLPYRAVDLVLRNALGEHLAFVWIPLVFAGIELMCGGELKQRVRAFALTAIGFALLILSNIPSAVAVGIAVPIYALVRQGRSGRVLLLSIAPMLAGALLSAFYLLPALSLRELIQSSHLWDAGTSTTGSAFTLSEVFTKNSNSLTNANLVTLLAGVLALILAVQHWRKHRENDERAKPMMGWRALIAIAVIMQLPGVATFVYQLPVVSFLQFSWRWNILLVPAIVTIFVLLYEQKQQAVLLSTMALAITSVLVVTGFNAKYKLHHSTDVLKVEYSDAFEYMPQTALHSTQALAKFVSQHRTDPPVLMNGAGSGALTSQHGDRRGYLIDLPQATSATFHLFYWPLWQLTVDGHPITSTPDSLGRMTALIPAGKHAAMIERIEHESEAIGKWMSILSMLLLLAVYWYPYKTLR